MRLFRWIRSLFQPASDSFDVYAPEERLIYTFWNGKERVRADPVVLYKRLMTKGPELSVHITVSTSPSKGAAAAHESMLKIIREIFSISKPAQDSLSCEDTLSQVELCSLLDHFLLFTERLKKKSNLFVIPSSNTAVSPVTSPEDQATYITAESGSIEKEQPTGEPTPSPMEPALPSA